MFIEFDKSSVFESHMESRMELSLREVGRERVDIVLLTLQLKSVDEERASILRLDIKEMSSGISLKHLDIHVFVVKFSLVDLPRNLLHSLPESKLFIATVIESLRERVGGYSRARLKLEEDIVALIRNIQLVAPLFLGVIVVQFKNLLVRLDESHV